MQLAERGAVRSGLPVVREQRGRVLQGVERFWLAAERLRPGFVIQRVVEGTLDPEVPEAVFVERLLGALASVAAVRPGLCLRLSGWGPWLAWRADAAPGVRIVLAPGWEGLAPVDGLAGSLPLRRGAVELVWLPGSPARIVLRAHHAAADGRTIDGWVQGLFAALRGEPVEPVGFAPIDVVILPPSAGRWRGLPRDASPVTGAPSSDRLDATWARVRVCPAPAHDVLVRLLLAVRDVHPGPGAPRVSLPVDLRAVGLGTGDGNLSGIATLGAGALSSVATARAAVIGAREPSANAGILHFAHAQRWLPLWLLAAAGRGAALAQLRGGAFEASLTVSNLGRSDLGRHSGGGFEASGAWWIPPATPGNPCLLLLSGDGTGLDLCAAAPVALADGGRLGSWLANVAERLRGAY